MDFLRVFPGFVRQQTVQIIADPVTGLDIFSGNDEEYMVIVEDDGVGFNMTDVDFTNNTHFGINNIKQRLSTMCRANMEINSEVGKGTKAIVHFYK